MPTVLIVDDERYVLVVLSDILQCVGYQVLTASSAEEALKYFNFSSHAISLVISDVTMPGSSGPEFIEIVQKLAPETKAMLMSGYSPTALDCNVPFLSKPFSVQSLLAAVQKLLPNGEP